jgi:hypothetical protein
MNFFNYLFSKKRIVRSTEISSSVQQTLVAIKIIPSEISDIVSKLQILSSEGIGRINNTCGYKSPNDTIIEAQNVGSRFLKNIKPENLFFFFGETVESLQSAFCDFCNNHLIPYPLGYCYAPLYDEQSYQYNESKPNILAVVLCKIINADSFQKTFFAEQQKGGSSCKCYEVSWSELQDLQKNIRDFGESETHCLAP